jgi:Leucine-rich repeat (LRR) protein
LGELTALRYLDLQRPHALDAASIFPQLAELPSLRALRFRHPTIDKLPESIRGLGAIEWLSVGSRLTALPSAVGSLSTLRGLDVEFNDLSALPDSIACVPRLESITLHANPRLDLVQAVSIVLGCATLRRVLLPATNVPDAVYATLSSAGFARRKGTYGDPWVRGDGPVVQFRSYA